MLKDKRVWAGLAVVVLGIGSWLAFGFFGVHKAFVDDEVSEEGPIFASGAQKDDDTVGDATTTIETETSAKPESEIESEGDSASSTSTAAVSAEPVVVTEKTGSFSGSGNYSVSGTTNVLSDGQQRFVRFEGGFSSSNGPDLKVYLRADDGDFINLGKLKGNKGGQNYEVDISVDLAKYNKVEIWCERFSVGFGSASLA